MDKIAKLQVGTSNPGKLREYRAMAGDNPIEIEPLPHFAELPAFAEDAPTFAENSAGKALHYSRFSDQLVIADDSGLVVPALGGAPGVRSARYAGPNASDADRVRKLLSEMRGKSGEERRARFVCVLTLAQDARALAVFSDSVDGEIAEAPHGTEGFGYDPVFYFPKLHKTYAEIAREQKNEYSHRGRAFCKLMLYLFSPESHAAV